MKTTHNLKDIVGINAIWQRGEFGNIWYSMYLQTTLTLDKMSGMSQFSNIKWIIEKNI